MINLKLNTPYINFVIILTQVISLLCLKNSIINENYTEAFIYYLAQPFCYFLISYNKKFLKRVKFIIFILTSIITPILYTLFYNYLLGYLYVSYVKITGIRNPLFINNAFLANLMIIWSTIFLIYLLFILCLILYSTFVLKGLNTLSSNKKTITKNSLSLFFFILPSFMILEIMSSKYKNPENINSVIKYYLYNYQYYDNDMGDETYVCSNLKALEQEGEKIKVYPLFTEDKVSYVIKSKDSYQFRIAECKND